MRSRISQLVLSSQSVFSVSSYDETLAAWFYYDLSTGETQWDHPLDSVFREKVLTARAALVRSHHSETEQTKELPRDEQEKVSEEIPGDPERHVRTRLTVDVDENTEISVDTCEILEQSDRAMMPLVRSPQV